MLANEFRRASPQRIGRAVISASDCSYPPAVHAGDLLCVDFDRKTIGPDGLYLIEWDAPGGVEWRGCRRFAKTGSGIAMDVRGNGDWQALSSMDNFAFRVVGHVVRVYHETNV